jgi:hypothetical protein
MMAGNMKPATRITNPLLGPMIGGVGFTKVGPESMVIRGLAVWIDSAYFADSVLTVNVGRRKRPQRTICVDAELRDGIILVVGNV